MQQTRVMQGLSYYLRFIDQFPTVDDLARAGEDEVLRAWQGLGYYSRARNMHAAAKQVVEDHKGHFPSDHDTLIQLKGIGAYTAAAISSIAASEARPVVDGNVIRVISRLYGIEEDTGRSTVRKQILTRMHGLMQGHEPGEFNQAVMEFGALQCVPRSPNCGICPLSERCSAFQSGKVAEIPLKARKSTPKERYLNFLVFRDLAHPDDLFLQKMPPGDIWQGLYSFPFIETPGPATAIQLAKTTALAGKVLPNAMQKEGGELVHVLSHQRIHANFFVIHATSQALEDIEKKHHRVRPEEQKAYPMPRLMIRHFEDNV